MNTKAASERYQRQVLEISKQPGNESCADCRGRYPRWASWNLGIFLCVSCAGVHRKMGTHISKIKSLTLDTWTKEQVERMREGGNEKNNLKFNPDERRNRPPANVDEGERNNELERFIFDKYKGRFMDKPPPVPSKDPPLLRLPDSSVDENRSRRLVSDGLESFSSAAEALPRSRTAPIPSSWADAKRAASVSPIPNHQQRGQAPAPVPALPVRATPSSSSTLGPPSSIPLRTTSDNAPRPSEAPSLAPTVTSSVFDDLISLSNGTPAVQQPPLQMQSTSYQNSNLGNPWAALGTHQQALISPMMMTNTSAAASYFQQGPSAPPLQQQQQPRSPAFFSTGAQERSASLGSMAFPGSSPFASQQVNGQSFFPASGAQLMGQQAFGQYQQPQISPLVAPQQTGQYSYVQQQPQQQPPQLGNFASSMMPTSQPSAPPFPTASWQHNQSHMWQ